MCTPAVLGFLIPGGAAAATAAGATAAAATIGATLQTVGTIVGIGGALYQGIAGAKAAKEQSKAIQAQMKTEAQLTAVQDQRTREQFKAAIAQQRADLAARGVSLDSPTAILLGQTAAQELSFESQSIRSSGSARQVELSAADRAARADRATSVLKGFFSAAGTALKAAPDIWPGLSDLRLGQRKQLA